MFSSAAGTDLNFGHESPLPLLFVVEDDPDIAGLLRQVLSHAGYRLQLFTHGSQVVHAAAIQRPALIILDGMLPDVDGYDVLRLLKQDSRTTDIPAMMLSARGTDSDKSLALKLGASFYIVKPFRTRDLLTCIGGLALQS